MAVPDTTTFTLQDVVDEVNPTTDDLVDCFADAVASKFDSAYEGSKNQLLNFRNYGATPCVAFLTSSLTFRNACAGTAAQQNATYYHNGSGSAPSVGDTVYTDSSCTTTLGGGNRPYYSETGKPAEGTYTTNSSGVVTSGTTAC